MKRRIFSIIIIFTILFSLFGCGKKESETMSMILQVDTGDSIKMTIDKTEGHVIGFDKDTSIIDIKNQEGAAIIRGEFVPQESYSFLYEKLYTEENCEIMSTGTENGASYTYGVYHNGNSEVCEYIAWVVGTNTGIVFESSSVGIEDFEETINKVTFSVEKTSQVNENYAYEPHISEGSDSSEETAEDNVEKREIAAPVSSTALPEETDAQQENQEETKTDVESSEEDEGPGETAKADWTSLMMKIDGVEYSFPYSYSLLKSNGWDFNIQDYLEEGQTEFLLSEGEYTYSTTKLKNPIYGTDLGTAEIYVGFKNYDVETKNITDCDLWALEVVAVYGSQPIENRPEIELPGGIRFGSTYDEIIAAYGEPDTVYDDNEYYIQLDYERDYNQHMTLYIYKGEGEGEASGLLDVELRGYN